jgi:murein DD-endopeptidase MepM/ murein hydrolase activator NlpD
VPVLRWIGLTAVALSLALGTAGPAGADPNDDKARVDKQLADAAAHLEIASARAQQAAAEYAAAVAALPGAEAALAEAQGRVAAAEAAARQAEREAETARTEQAGADRQYTAAAGQVDVARGEVGRFAAATYKGENLRLFDSLVNAGTPTKLAVRLGYLDRVAGAQQSALARVTAARGQVREQRSLVAAATRRAEQASAAAARALADSQAAAARALRAKERVTALIAQKENAVTTANSERSAVLARYEELKAESARVEAELRAAARRHARAAAPVAPQGSAYFLTPVRGHKTSGFGSRFHPIFHVWLLHSGLDLGAPFGSPIVAAADGEVVQAGWRGGYGNYTCIYHGEYQGKGLATCYGHQSQIGVHTGQQVRRGEVIGRVGSTGNSTGPHLHFEVRRDGVPEDPENWLPSCLC